jgi:uncharacterized protein (DUF2249 family)
MSVSTFEEYYKRLGLARYPFGVFTTEGERDVFKDIYLKPQNYSVIAEGLLNTSAIIVGERGTGKTALSLELGSGLEDKKNLFVRIEEFSDLKVGYNQTDLYKFLTERIVEAFFMKYAERPTSLWKLSKDERRDLSMFFHQYLGASSRTLLIEKVSKIQNGLAKRFFISLYNIIRTLLNYGLKALTKIISDAVTRHFSALPPFDSNDAEYLARLKVEVDMTFEQNQRQYFYLEKICRLARRAGCEKIYVFIDKVDEDTRFQNDAEDISEYLRLLASDNKVLTSDLFHMALFMWSTPFNYIRDTVRTQKLTFASLTWNHDSLDMALKRRLEAYASKPIKQELAILSECLPESRDLLFEMCNHNPRDLWHLLNMAFEEQFRIDPEQKIGDDAVSTAIRRFVREFNYYEYYPRKSNARANTMDVYKYIKHLQRLDSVKFTKDKLNTLAGTGGSTNNYVVAMENMGLIRNTSEKAQGGAVIYEINDPKVRYAMQYGIQIEE